MKCSDTETGAALRRSGRRLRESDDTGLDERLEMSLDSAFIVGKQIAHRSGVGDSASRAAGLRITDIHPQVREGSESQCGRRHILTDCVSVLEAHFFQERKRCTAFLP